MTDLLGYLVIASVLVFLFRRQIKRAARRWAEGGETVNHESLADIFARERQRMREGGTSEGPSEQPPP